MSEARDPVCGMTVDTANAPAESHVGGHDYYFCSISCKNRFDADPAAYEAGGRDAGTSSERERHEPPRTTAGGVTAPKFGSAGSGGAELDSIPEQHGKRGHD